MIQITFLISFIFMAYILYTLTKRIQNLEDSKGIGEGFTYRIDAHEALLNCKMLGRVLGIDAKGPANKWQESVWHSLNERVIENNAYLQVAYLPGINAYSLSYGDGKSYIVPLEIGKTLLYSANYTNDVALKQKGIMNGAIQLKVYERLMCSEKEKCRRYISICIVNTDTLRDRQDPEIVCDFPLDLYSQDEYEREGFKVERVDDVYTDIFGDDATYDSVQYSKNGVVFSH